MMNNLKKVLLTGTALIAAAGFTASAQAADLTLTGNAVWGTDGGDGMVATPTTADNVIMSTHSLQIDATETGVTQADAITATTGNIAVNTTGDADVTFTLGSIAATGTSNITVDNLDASTNRNVTLGVTGAVSTAGNVVIQNTETGGGSTAVAVTVGGNFTVSGAGTTNISVTGTGQTGNTATLDLDGATNTFAGAVTVTGGANDATNDATLRISGASTTFTGGLTLDTDVGDALLVLDGAVAQTVAGNIAGDGTVNVTNAHASGATFTGDFSGTTVVTTANATAVAFQGSTAAGNTITLGDGDDTITATFGTSTATTIAGDVEGSAGGDTVGLVFAGGNTVTLTGAATSDIDTVTVNGNTTLESDAAITAAVTIESGSTLEQGTGLITGDVANAGTLTFVATAHDTDAITGNVTGAGALDVNDTSGVTGNVAAASADIAAGETFTVGGNYAVTTTTLNDATSTLALTTGSNLTGNVVAAANEVGVITLTDTAATTAIAGDIGTSTAEVDALTVAAGANAAVVTTTGNLYVDTITLGANDSLQFIGSAAQTVSGAIAGTGDVTISNTAGDVTFSGAVAGATSTVAASATVRYNDDATYSGAYTNTGGTTTVSASSTLTAQSFTDDGSYVLQANGADIGQLEDSAGAADLDEEQLSINVTGAVDVANVGGVLTGFNAFVADTVLTDDSAQYTFTLAANGDIAVTKATATSFATSSATAGAGAAIDDLGDAPSDADLLALVDRVAAASSAEAVDTILEQSVSDVSAGAAVAGLTVSNQTAQITGQRLASLRTGTGVAAGGHMDNGLKAWGQVFGTTADQDKRDGVAGYDADTAGFAAGIDTELNDNTVVGLALSYANTEVDSEDANASSTDVDTYQVTVYGDYDIDENTFVNGQVSFAHGQNDTTRKNVGGTSDTAKGDFDSKQFGIRAEVGRSYAAGNGLTLVPSVLANYVHYDADSYTETGAGGANLTVDAESLNVFELGANVELSTTQEFTDGSALKPSLNLGVRHDLVGDEFEASNTFAGGGSAFKVEGFDPAQTTLSLGAGVTYFSADQWELTAEYDFEAKSDYQSHSGLVKAAYKF